MTPIDWQHSDRRPLPAGEHPKTWPVWGIPRADGREVELESIHQRYIYAGDLLGAMRPPQHHVDRVVEMASSLHPWCNADPVVIPPVLLEYSLPRMPIQLSAPSEESLGAVTLPRVATIALLTSHREALDSTCCFSSLMVIWFQEAFGDAPESILRQIAALDWNALAFDWTP